MILPAIRSLLLSRPSISAAIGTRIFPYTIDYDTPKPAIAIRVLPAQMMSQTLLGQRNVRQNLITVDCFSMDNYSVSDQLAIEAQSDAIIGFRGVLEGVTILGITSEGGIEHDVDGVEPGSNRRVCVTSIDLEVVWAV